MTAFTTRPAPATLDELAEALRDRRGEAGSPSFTSLTRRVGELRAERGGSRASGKPHPAWAQDA
jgi:hypothetical protein